MNEFSLFDEPNAVFAGGKEASDPHDGLALFGALDSTSTTGQMPAHVVIGTANGVRLWQEWSTRFNEPASCVEVARQRPWPPFVGYEVAFGCVWPQPARQFELDEAALDVSSRRLNKNERVYQVVDQYLTPFESIKKMDEQPSTVICVVPDFVYQNCRPKSYVSDTTESESDRLILAIGKEKAKTGQMSFFEESHGFGEAIDVSDQFGYSLDFRRQLKARVMPHGIPIQIVKESTLTVTDQIQNGEKGTNPLSDRLWNLGTSLYYKSGKKPWKIAGTRDGVCYLGISYKLQEGSNRTACCAAQMFIDNGDGIVFLGDFGPWYSEKEGEFHLTGNAAEKLLRGALETFRDQGGQEVKEIFLHAKSGINYEEICGFRRAVSKDCKIVGVKVRQDRGGVRMFRNGRRPVLRGMFWKQSQRHGLLYTNGFKPRIGTYDGFEVPVPLEIRVQHGRVDIETVAKDILALTKLNYNACLLGEGMPITIKFSSAIGEILLANPSLPRSEYRHNFKFYI